MKKLENEDKTNILREIDRIVDKIRRIKDISNLQDTLLYSNEDMKERLSKCMTLNHYLVEDSESLEEDLLEVSKQINNDL